MSRAGTLHAMKEGSRVLNRLGQAGVLVRIEGEVGYVWFDYQATNSNLKPILLCELVLIGG